MKKLVFNGCSFMAGDELVWEKYQKEHNKELQSWYHPKFTDTLARLDYSKYYRKKFNLPAIVSGKLGCEWVDLSADGRSNTSIAVETLAYLNSCSKEERQKYHVIIGWTCVGRILKYSPTQQLFLNLTAQHYSEHTEDPSKEELREHIKTQILGSDDQDFILDYLRNIMLLENYLISNNISYTFYRAIDDTLYNFKNIGPFDYGSPYVLNVEECTNHNNWYPFSGAPIAPIYEYGWNMVFFNKPNLWVSPENSHPGIPAVNYFSTKLAEFVKRQNVV